MKSMSLAVIFVLMGCAPAATTSSPSQSQDLGSTSTNPPLRSLSTSDDDLKLGKATTAVDDKAVPVRSKETNKQTWIIYSNPWGVTSGTGSTVMTYTGSGAINTQVKYQNLNSAGIHGYPFIGYGYDVWGYKNLGQAPEFPVRLNTLSSLNVNFNYALTGSTFPRNLDVAFDEWIMPDPAYKDGAAGSLEVLVATYAKFADSSGCKVLKTFSASLTVNDKVTTALFDEQKCGHGPGAFVLFLPKQNLSSANVKLDLVPFLNEAATQAGISKSWYLAGVNFGSEFGGSPNVDYGFNITKFGFTQTFY